jgi:organic radical activating enzyme
MQTGTKHIFDQKYKSVDFYLSKSCNKSCYYCTAWTLQMRNLHVDMDFLRTCLEGLSPFNTKINLLGGEPGLIKNLNEVIAMIREYPNFMIQILSNSLIRKFYPHVLEDPEIIYMEHLVLDFHEDRIEKLGNYPFIPPNNKNNFNLIIKTPNYYKYRDVHDLSEIDHDQTILKPYNSRSPEYDVTDQAAEIDRKMCAKFPSVPVIDFEIQKIRHCSKKVINGSRQFDVTSENLNKMMTFKLFDYENYCIKCTEYINPRGHYRIANVLEMLNEYEMRNNA